jgi:hypothetical protein
MSTSEQQTGVTRHDPLAPQSGTDRYAEAGTDRYAEDREVGRPEFTEAGGRSATVDDPMLSRRDEDTSATDTRSAPDTRSDVGDPAGAGSAAPVAPVATTGSTDAAAGDAVDRDRDTHDRDTHDRDTHDRDALERDARAGTDPSGTEDEGRAGGMTETRIAAGTGAAVPSAGSGTGAAGSAGAEGHNPLVPRDRADAYAARWNEVKGMFVDEPRQAVQQADVLVGELLADLERLFTEQRQDIERGLDTDDTSTEDLRMALHRYRSFFDRLLSL